MTRREQRWQVELGAEHWQRHTHGHWEEDVLRLVGRIARAGQFGALGITPDGNYVQVNGDHVVPINRSQVEYALRRAQSRIADRPPRTPPGDRPAPVVIIKRRRTVTRAE